MIAASSPLSVDDGVISTVPSWRRILKKLRCSSEFGIPGRYSSTESACSAVNLGSLSAIARVAACWSWGYWVKGEGKVTVRV